MDFIYFLGCKREFRYYVSFLGEAIEGIVFRGDIHEILRKYQLVALTRMADIAAYYLD